MRPEHRAMLEQARELLREVAYAAPRHAPERPYYDQAEQAMNAILRLAAPPERAEQGGAARRRDGAS